MTRTDVLQAIIDKIRARTYLEIGVLDGGNFMPIRARRKIAIDPQFKITRKSRMKWLVKNPVNLWAEFHEMTSDAYFVSPNAADDLDVVFVDGLHTYEQSLRDVTNALPRLSDRGVIVLHDCSPPHAAAAFAAPTLKHAREANLPGWDATWCGDVWKTICHLRSLAGDLRVFVLDCDYGVGVVTKGTPEKRLAMSEEAVAQLTYEDLRRNRQELLNLRPPEYLYEFLRTL